MKKYLILSFIFVCQTFVFAQNAKKFLNQPSQVFIQEAVNLSDSEKTWLLGVVQDKLKDNLQEYLNAKIVVDSKAESYVKKLQAESESYARNQTDTIEFGKITTAKYAYFTKIRRTSTGYTISVDYTDLTTGEQIASASSKEYLLAENLYNNANGTCAIDEVTLSLANKFGIKLNSLNKQLLSNGNSFFSLEQQMNISKQNEELYRKKIAEYDKQIKELEKSEDIYAVQNIAKIQAEKALLKAKEEAEKRRIQELELQKNRIEEDSKLEAQRDESLKNQRDAISKIALERAEEIRNLKIAKQGILGQIKILESKKKSYVEINKSIEDQSLVLYNQYEKDLEEQENVILKKQYSTVELDSDGKPTLAAKNRRQNLIRKSKYDLTNKFFTDCDELSKSVEPQLKILQKEIVKDIDNLKNYKKLSSLGDELKVTFGPYEGSKNGWSATLSLYSEGLLFYSGNFIVDYEALSGKKTPNIETELDDNVINEYTNNVDMYNSLLVRGDPVVFFELEYNVTPIEDNTKPSEYYLNFKTINTVNLVTGKEYIKNLNSSVPIKMNPSYALVNSDGIVRKLITRLYYQQDEVIPRDSKISMYNTEITQKMYSIIMGENPSKNIDNISKNEIQELRPVENVSFFDAMYFCNKLSEECGLLPCYTVEGISDVTKWNYIPHKDMDLQGYIECHFDRNGYRLPTYEEWKYFAYAGEYTKYAGSNKLNDVAWTIYNSGSKTHQVALKNPNNFSMYDMSGNVREWLWDNGEKSGNYGQNKIFYFAGGCVSKLEDDALVKYCHSYEGIKRNALTGFRIARTLNDKASEKRKAMWNDKFLEPLNFSLETINIKTQDNKDLSLGGIAYTLSYRQNIAYSETFGIKGSVSYVWSYVQPKQEQFNIGDIFSRSFDEKSNKGGNGVSVFLGPSFDLKIIDTIFIPLYAGINYSYLGYQDNLYSINNSYLGWFLDCSLMFKNPMGTFSLGCRYTNDFYNFTKELKINNLPSINITDTQKFNFYLSVGIFI